RVTLWPERVCLHERSRPRLPTDGKARVRHAGNQRRRANDEPGAFRRREAERVGTRTRERRTRGVSRNKARVDRALIAQIPIRADPGYLWSIGRAHRGPGWAKISRDHVPPVDCTGDCGASLTRN